MNSKWDKDYQAILSTTLDSWCSSIIVKFANGDERSIPIASLESAKGKHTDLRWQEACIGVHGLCLVVPAAPDDLIIPWDTLRTLTDADFARHVDNLVAKQNLSIGARLRQLRQAQGINQAQLATLAGIEPANLSRIENGHSDPSASTLLKVLAAMGCSARDLAEPSRSEVNVDANLNSGDLGQSSVSRDVAATLIIRRHGGGYEEILAVWDEKSEDFTLPMARRHKRFNSQLELEDWYETAARATVKWLGATCTRETGQPRQLWEIGRGITDANAHPEWQEATFDPFAKQLNVRVFALHLPVDYAIGNKNGMITEWLCPREFINEQRLLISPMARWIMTSHIDHIADYCLPK